MQGCAIGTCYSLPPKKCSVPATQYQNLPHDNSFFCGMDYDMVTQKCLESKPCPSGDHASCPGDEGCYIVPSCTIEYNEHSSPDITLATIPAEETSAAAVESSPETVVGSSYCTHSPNYTCYAAGWPACCTEESWDNCPPVQPFCDVAADVPPPALASEAVESTSTTAVETSTTSGFTTGAAEVLQYTNPPGGRSFCGETSASVKDSCLTSKPCPDGSARECPDNQRCYIVQDCAVEYASAAATTAENDPTVFCQLCHNTEMINGSKEVEHENENITCNEFGNLFVTEFITEGSPTCTHFQESCCQPNPGPSMTQESFVAGQVPASFSSPASTNPKSDLKSSPESAPGFEAWYNNKLYSRAATTTVFIGWRILPVMMGLFVIC